MRNYNELFYYLSPLKPDGQTHRQLVEFCCEHVPLLKHGLEARMLIKISQYVPFKPGRHKQVYLKLVKYFFFKVTFLPSKCIYTNSIISTWICFQSTCVNANFAFSMKYKHSYKAIVLEVNKFHYSNMEMRHIN